jgi:hypothetical protein
VAIITKAPTEAVPVSFSDEQSCQLETSLFARIRQTKKRGCWTVGLKPTRLSRLASIYPHKEWIHWVVDSLCSRRMVVRFWQRQVSLQRDHPARASAPTRT